MNRAEYDIRTKDVALKAFEAHRISFHSDRRWLIQKRYDDDKGWEWNMAAEVVGLTNRALYVGGDIECVVFAHGPASAEELVGWIGGTSDVSYYVQQKASIGMGGGLLGKAYESEIAIADIEDLEADYLEDLVSENGDPDTVEAMDFVKTFVHELAGQKNAAGAVDRFKTRLMGVPEGEVRDGLLRLVVNVPDLGLRPKLETWHRMMVRGVGGELSADDLIVQGLRKAKRRVDDGYHELLRYLIDMSIGAGHSDFMDERYDVGMVTPQRVYYAWAAVVRLKQLLQEEASDEETARVDRASGRGGGSDTPGGGGTQDAPGDAGT